MNRASNDRSIVNFYFASVTPRPQSRQREARREERAYTRPKRCVGIVLVTYADLLGLWGAMEGPTAAGLSIPTWASGGMAGWVAYPDGIGGTD